MKFDGIIEIATGLSAKTKIWKNKKVKWSDLVRRLTEENRTNETYKEFIAASKEEQLKIKDVGGFVGAYLRNGKRSPKSVVHRQIISLDIDFAHPGFWDDFTLQFDNAAFLHGTHKHSPTNPRLRLIMPLSRECSPDEYVAVSRQIAGFLGIDLFDNTTFETNRLMFWPSNPKDVEYYFEQQDGPWIDVDEILGTYADWKDTSLWPTADSRMKEINDAIKKQEDPELKKGVVGYFCRTYEIEDAIDEFLQGVYTKSDIDERYTYSLGSTSSGLMLYDGKFAYSHHGTDPCGGKLCNAFDLVRIHLYGHLDEENANPNGKLKSFASMEPFVLNDKKVKKTIAVENLENSKYDFGQLSEYNEDSETHEEINFEEDLEWMTDLEADSKGNYLSTSTNINMILSNDARLKGIFKENGFDNKRYVFSSLPWRKITKPDPIKNVDYSGIRNYIEGVYGISSSLKIDDSLALEFERNSFHPIKDYLLGVEWDQTPRIDNLLIEYFGAEDNIYHREAIRKMLVAAVSRVFRPGCKFDLVLTLVGEQGTKKSTFIKKLGKAWFSDTFMTVHGKEALEQIQGAWLIEMAELSGLRKAEVESVKHFISKQEDMFRPAYARTPETFPRQCVFFGTTNKKDFLTDTSGNRRFMPVAVVRSRVTKDVFKDLTDLEIDQIWAEAYVLFTKKEPLFLSNDAEKIAQAEQCNHSETDERKGIIEFYLDRTLPKGWDDLDLSLRKDFLHEITNEGTEFRDTVCMAEVWCECLGKERDSMSRYNTREINDILKGIEGWEYINSTKNFKIYGKQKYYIRKLE